jgi:ubiquinone/menaquinone biosynthesis C-methylase UbiE
MKKTYINSGFSYKNGYDDSLMRGVDEARPWNLTQQILQIASTDKQLLDIGCGSGMKLVELSNHFQWITGLDYNPEMLQLAIQRFKQHDIKNCSFIEGTATSLPFKGETFDVVSSMMAPHCINEMFRVLQPMGNLIIEIPGEMDKRTLKDFFVSGNTPRGQLSDRPEGSIHALYEEELAPLFENIIINDGYWNTYYSEEGLLALLLNTPTVADFNIEHDQDGFERALVTLPRIEGKIILTQHRLLIKARKPRK